MWLIEDGRGLPKALSIQVTSTTALQIGGYCRGFKSCQHYGPIFLL